jgi:hypothetical protein
MILQLRRVAGWAAILAYLIMECCVVFSECYRGGPVVVAADFHDGLRRTKHRAVS